MNLGITEMIFIFLVALLIFGPRKLPEIGRQIGRGLAEFKRASNQFKYQIEDEMRQIEAEEHQEGDQPQPKLAAPEGTVAAESSSESGTNHETAAEPVTAEVEPEQMPASRSGGDGA